jgi:two-component system response regulator PilR (NtrC family)
MSDTPLGGVLVVEDEPSVRESVERVLAAEGIPVSFARDLRGALRHPWRASCRAALCDLKLPDGSGLDFLKAMHADRPHVSVVVCTGFATAQTLAEAANAGATDVLVKPFDTTELLHVVARAIAATDALTPKEDYA